jgi:hypothetical protein
MPRHSPLLWVQCRLIPPHGRAATHHPSTEYTVIAVPPSDSPKRSPIFRRTTVVPDVQNEPPSHVEYLIKHLHRPSAWHQVIDRPDFSLELTGTAIVDWSTVRGMRRRGLSHNPD